MGTNRIWVFTLCLLFVGVEFLSAQETEGTKNVLKKEQAGSKTGQLQEASIRKIRVAEHTMLSTFEPSYVIPVEERIAQKKRRIAETYRKKEILDTLDISDRQRKKLLRDLRRSPFSNRLSKALVVETKFEDEEVVDK